ncbi:polysaccharide deacetylase family protein [Anaerobacillus arseniciselenatis]|nr:polysaccharide deacetylase family protein [Anaerobacillus arseniciselenatis]
MSTKITYKILIAFCFLFVFLIFHHEGTFAEESTLSEATIIIDGQPIKTKYVMREGNLLVPALFLKHTGVKVDHNEQYGSMVFSYGGTMFALPVGKNYSDDLIGNIRSWIRRPLATYTVEINDEVFVPLVDVVRKFDMDVAYNHEKQQTSITTKIPHAQNRISRGNPEQKLVALTFDDGPDSHYTPQILDILKEKNVRATFFVMGQQVEHYPNIMKRIVEEGHGIANHTWSHPQLPQVMTSQLKEEVTTTQNIMQKTVGRSPDLFRPPFGALTKSDALVLQEMGMRNIMWTVDTLDWSGLSAEEILAIVHRDISPGGIILQHNFQPHAPTARLLDGSVEALQQIIDDLRAKGYQFVTVQTLLAN